MLEEEEEEEEDIVCGGGHSVYNAGINILVLT